MADRVYPHYSPRSETMTRSPVPAGAAKNSLPAPSGAYLIHVPRDQIHRYRSSENSRLYAHYPRREPRRCRCCYNICWFIGAVFTLSVLLAVAAGVLYFIIRPKSPDYSIESISIKGMENLTSALSPEFDVAVRADNGNNDKIGIRYVAGSSVMMFYKDAALCDGALPAFYQPPDNVTVLETALNGKGVNLTAFDRRALVKAAAKRSVPLTLKLRAPVRIKVWSVETWKITVKVDCDVTVDELTEKARTLNKDCSYGVDLWW